MVFNEIKYGNQNFIFPDKPIKTECKAQSFVTFVIACDMALLLGVYGVIELLTNSVFHNTLSSFITDKFFSSRNYILYKFNV